MVHIIIISTVFGNNAKVVKYFFVLLVDWNSYILVSVLPKRIINIDNETVPSSFRHQTLANVKLLAIAHREAAEFFNLLIILRQF